LIFLFNFGRLRYGRQASFPVGLDPVAGKRWFAIPISPDFGTINSTIGVQSVKLAALPAFVQ